MSRDLRIVLVGNIGVGKSASANTILGKVVFESEISATGTTEKCQMANVEEDGRDLYVIDTPGLLDTKSTKEGIKKCIELSFPGPHAFLFVIQLGRFTQEEQNTVKMMKKIFGEESAKYTITLFTNGERLGETEIEKFIEQNDALKEFISQVQNRYHVIENKVLENRSQVTELLRKIDKMVADNGGTCYPTEMLGDKELEKLLQSHEKKKATIQQSLLNDSDAHKYTIGGAIAGAVGGTIGSAASGFVMAGPVGAVIGAFVGLAGGGGLGAAAGIAIDQFKAPRPSSMSQ